MKLVSLLPGGGIHGESGLAIPPAGEEFEAEGAAAEALLRSGLVKAAESIAAESRTRKARQVEPAVVEDKREG